MPRPDNILWITTDHMRWDNIAAHGFPFMHTPNLDRLVGRGVTFSRCFANSPLCMPSRCSFMTGCYPPATGVTRNGQELAPDFEPTLPRMMNAAGYRTVQIGKLHFQGHEDHDLDPRARHDYGFQNFQVSEEPGCYDDAYRTWLGTEHPEWLQTFTVGRPGTPERSSEARTPKVLEAPWECSHSGWVAHQGCHNLNSRPKNQFIHLGFYAPHPPLNPTREMFEPYRDVEIPPHHRHPDDPRDPHKFSEEELVAYKKHFCAMVTGVDLALGKILRKLEENGQLDNALIIFGSDHGDACGDHGRVAKNPQYYESVMRLPLVLHWPDGLGTEPRTEDALVEMVDVLPTLCEIAGQPLHPAFQGHSYAGELLNQEPVRGREDVYAHHGDGEIMLRGDRWKYLAYLDKDPVKECLFDLEADPHEFVNLSSNPDFREQLGSMRFRALQRLAQASRSPRNTRLRF